MALTTTLTNIARPIIRLLEFLGPVALLGIRLSIAWDFWKSGVNKFQSWDSTIWLFENEYHVPLLSPKAAAYLGTGAELLFPAMLAIGLGGRFAAVSLFVFNIIAVISYPTLNPAGVYQHQLWGLMLLIPMFFGPGKISIDHFIRKKYMGDTLN